jgi:agmatinase
LKRATPHNFGNLKRRFSDYKNSRIVILPVPFEKTSSWLRGSAKGPDAIIDASKNLEFYDIETGSEVYREGIHTASAITSSNSVEMINKVYGRARTLLNDSKFIVLLGGEHTVSLGSIKAHAEHYPELSILHLDAHTDRRDSYEGNRYNHACVMARAIEILGARGRGQKQSIISVGIRSMDSSELPYIDKRKIFYASDIKKHREWVKKVTKELSDNVYVTIDMDVFDPSIVPSTGTPEPGGLDWYEVMGLLRTLSLKKRVVGFDVVELRPSENRAPDFLAAKLIYTFLSYVFMQK